MIGNVLINRYMENLDWVRDSTSDDSLERLRPLLEHFRSSAAENDLDPLMLAAQAYQESELDHSKKSPAGAVGIMQIKPSTAADRNVGIDDISSPADNIRAGARYMRFLMDRYFSEPDMGEAHQWLFALAAYNAGKHRVKSWQSEREYREPAEFVETVPFTETRNYIQAVMRNYLTYHALYGHTAARKQKPPQASIPASSERESKG